MTEETVWGSLIGGLVIFLTGLGYWLRAHAKESEERRQRRKQEDSEVDKAFPPQPREFPSQPREPTGRHFVYGVQSPERPYAMIHLTPEQAVLKHAHDLEKVASLIEGVHGLMLHQTGQEAKEKMAQASAIQRADTNAALISAVRSEVADLRALVGEVNESLQQLHAKADRLSARIPPPLPAAGMKGK